MFATKLFGDRILTELLNIMFYCYLPTNMPDSVAPRFEKSVAINFYRPII